MRSSTPIAWARGTRPQAGADVVVPAALATLVYELLDAHADTAQLAAELAASGDVRWRAHLDYLQALQRVGRQTLARSSFEATR